MLRRIFDFKSAVSFQLSAISFLLLLSGCVSTSDFEAMQNDINQLKRDTFENKKEISEIRKDATQIKEQAAGSVKEDSFNAIRESQASLYSQVAEQSKELQVLSGRFDENKFFIDKTMKDNSIERELLRSQINNLETRVKELNEKLAKPGETSSLTPAQKPEAEQGAEKAPELKSEENTPAEAYEAAFNSFKEKKHKEAREKFTRFIKKFPKDGLAGNAHFWIGETYFAEKDFENAILAYETLIKNYPHNEKIPGALLKQGLSFMELGDKKTAKVIFEKIIEKYPDSKEAGTAKKKKAEIDKKPAKGR